MKIRYLVSGRPAIIIGPQGINYKEMRKLNMNLDDLIEALRGNGVFNIEDTAYAIMETNGKIAVIKKANIEPPTREDVKVEIQQNGLPVNIIMDGVLMKENVNLAGINDEFIQKCIKKAKIDKIKNVLLFTLDNQGNVFLQGKDAGQYYSFQMPFDGVGKW